VVSIEVDKRHGGVDQLLAIPRVNDATPVFTEKSAIGSDVALHSDNLLKRHRMQVVPSELYEAVACIERVVFLQIFSFLWRGLVERLVFDIESPELSPTNLHSRYLVYIIYMYKGDWYGKCLADVEANR
jgi:hypothetical protein